MKKFVLIILCSFLVIWGFFFIYHSLFNLHITAVFEELEPFPRNLNVYYKGFKLGKTVRVYPSKDFTDTRVNMILNAKDLTLPDNITAKVKRKDKKDYIELEYPSAPSVTYLRNNSIIQGKKGLDIASYIDKQAEVGGLDEIKDNLNDTVQSAGDTLDALTELIGTANDILKDLRPSLDETGKNLVVSSKNLADITDTLSNSTKPHKLNNTFANIEQTTKNIERTTKHFENASVNIANIAKHADTQTITLIDCIMQNTNTVILNINDIVKGFKSTLAKNFAGLKIMFGKPLAAENK